MITIRDPEELRPAYERLLALEEARKTHALKLLEKLRDFHTSEEQFAQVPEEHNVFDKKMIPLDTVFLINWMCVRPDRPIPVPADRVSEYDSLWADVERVYDYKKLIA